MLVMPPTMSVTSVVSPYNCPICLLWLGQRARQIEGRLQPPCLQIARPIKISVITSQIDAIDSDLQCNHHILHIKTTILRQGLRNYEKCIGERLHTHLDTTFCRLLDGATQVGSTCNFERPCSGNQVFVFYGILDSTDPVPKSILNLLYCVRIWTLDEKGHTPGILHFFDECELLFA